VLVNLLLHRGRHHYLVCWSIICSRVFRRNKMCSKSIWVCSPMWRSHASSMLFILASYPSTVFVVTTSAHIPEPGRTTYNEERPRNCTLRTHAYPSGRRCTHHPLPSQQAAHIIFVPFSRQHTAHRRPSGLPRGGAKKDKTRRLRHYITHHLSTNINLPTPPFTPPCSSCS
jgi:hypothetical protein